MKYTENEQVNNFIYKNIDRTKEAKHPVVMILAGQPGAGKGGVTKLLKENLNYNAIVVDPDQMRRYHPDQGKLLAADDKSAAFHTHEAASKWSDALRDAAIEHRRNIIIDGTLKTPEKAQILCELMKSHGYRVEIHTVAVNELQSRLGVIQRYESQKDRDGYGRWVPKDVHDKAYKGMLESVQRIENKKSADKICVHNRDGQELYENHLDTQGRWSKVEPNAAQEILREREKVWSKEIQDKIQLSLHQTDNLINKRNASSEQKMDFHDLRNEIENKIQQDKIRDQYKMKTLFTEEEISLRQSVIEDKQIYYGVKDRQVDHIKNNPMQQNADQEKKIKSLFTPEEKIEIQKINEQAQEKEKQPFLEK